MDNLIITRFWSRVDKRGADECWVWNAARNSAGHGVAWDGKRTRLAHRFAWFLTFGKWPKRCLLHKCDNPPCVNPRHMFEGTRRDNMLDMWSKGRGVLAGNLNHAKGSMHSGSKLTDSQVLEIRERRAAGASYDELAAMFGVTYSNIGAIVKRRSWSHIGGAAAPKNRLTKSEVIEIRRRADAGERHVKIAAAFGVAPSTVSAIILRRNWRKI